MTKAWVTDAIAGGIWGPGGLASDGTNIFATTGNTMAAAGQFQAPATFSYGESVVKLAAGPAFGGTKADYFAPTGWAGLDNGDTDIGGSGPIVVDVPGATPSALVVALGKDGNIYLLDRANLGGISTAMSMAHVASSQIIQAGAAYTTAMGTYVVFKGSGVGCPGGQSGDFTAVKISATNPPRATVAWCARYGSAPQCLTNAGCSSSPMVTTSDGKSDAIVWVIGGQLVGFDGDTGVSIFPANGGGGAVAGLMKFVTPIAANGRIFVAGSPNVYAFTMK